jgi:hypothetical protein
MGRLCTIQLNTTTVWTTTMAFDWSVLSNNATMPMSIEPQISENYVIADPRNTIRLH